MKKDGTPRFNIHYPKYKAGRHVVKPVKEEISYGKDMGQFEFCIVHPFKQLIAML